MATSTPRLWSQIAITESLHSQSEFVHTLALWLYRSGDCGFSFTLSNCPAELHENNHTFDAIMDVLLDNCGVWRDVHLNVRQKHMVKLLSAIPSRTPKIRKLAIWGVGDRRAISGTRLFSVPLISLTHLSIVHVATLFSSRSDGLLMENLRSLHLRLADQSDLIECLSRSPRLEELSARFEFSTQKLQPIHDHVNVCLAHLHYLDLSLDVHTWDQGRRGPFEHFDFPALKTLRIHVTNFNRQDANLSRHLWDLCTDFVCCYKTSLQNLEINGHFNTASPSFLSRLRKVTHLGVRIDLLSNEFIHGLVHRFSSSVHQPCPAYSYLESLLIFAPGDDHGKDSLPALVDRAAEEKSSTAVHPVTIVLPWHVLNSLRLPSSCVVEFMNHHDWMERRSHDLYRNTGWFYLEG